MGFSGFHKYGKDIYYRLEKRKVRGTELEQGKERIILN